MLSLPEASCAGAREGHRRQAVTVAGRVARVLVVEIEGEVWHEVVVRPLEKPSPPVF
jgi:hypothetical protein